MALRKPQDPSFDYNNLDINEERFFRGFGINDTENQAEITSRRTAVIYEANPHNLKHKSVETEQVEKVHQEAVYDAFPELSEAPERWKAAAMSWWITQATEPISRYDNTPNKSGKHGSKRERDRERSDSLSDSDAQSPRKMPHSHSLWARRSKGSFNDAQYSRESDSDAPASLESHFREPVDAIRRPSIRLPQTPALQNPSPASRGLVKIQFAQVPSNEVLTEINIAELSNGSTVSWEELTSVARSLSAFPGFCFTHALYLSPREKQNFAITHQGLLNTALEDFPPGTVPICTTQPVGASHHNSDSGPATSDFMVASSLPPQAPSLTSSKLNAPQYLHSRALEPRLSANLPSTWNAPSRHRTYSRGVSTFPTNYDDLVRSSQLNPERDSASKNSEKSTTQAQLGKTTKSPKNTGQREGTPVAVDYTPPALNNDRASDGGGKGRHEAPLALTPKYLHERGPSPTLLNGGSIKESRQDFRNGEVIDLTSDGDEDQPEADSVHKDREASDPQQQSNTTKTTGVSAIVEKEQCESEDEDDDEEPEDNKEADARAIAAAAEYTLSLADATTARQFAAKTDIKYWMAAAEVYNLPVSALQVPDDTPKVRMPATTWLSPDFEAFPHQYIGSNEVFKTSFGPMRGCILADEMGFGKTFTTILTYIINFFGVARTMSGVPALEALTFPHMNSGDTINGIRPRVGATFVSASAQGVESWPESWARIMGSSKALREFPAAWRPKLVLLHADGAKYCEKHGGECMGLYSAMTPKEWAEVLPLPDWDNKSRTPQGQTALDSHKWTGPCDWPDSPGATVDRPALTSTRYIIVCTNQSWRSRVTCTWNDNAASREYKGWVKTLNDPCPAKRLTQKARTDLEQKINHAKTEYFQKKGHMRDGFGPTQARRPCEGTNAKGTRKSGFKICDLDFAAWVVVDEIHAAAGEHTITYTEVVDRFRQNRPEEDWPGVTGITGSPLANGIGTTGVFVANVLQRKMTSTHEAVRALASFSLENFMGAWNHLQRTFKSAQRIRSKTKRQQYIDNQLANNGQIQQMNQIFGHIMRYFFIQRDYATQDPWGRQLNLIPAKQVVQYCDLQFEDEYHEKLLAAEQAVKAAANDKWEDAVRDWEAHGMSGDRPARPTLERADPAAYLTARLLASFPNLLEAIRVWQDANPSKPRIIGDACAWGNNLGTANLQVQSALRSERDIRQSFLWDIATEACEGSAKIAYIVQQARLVGSQTSCAPHPDARREADGDMYTYRSKFIATSGIRLARALLWCRLVQVFGDEAVVSVASSKDRRDAVPRWRDVQGPVWIMVAALGTICQSITLTEGHVLCALEPTPSNSKAVQVANRQYRIGQRHDTVLVQWLLHRNSSIEQNIASGNRLRNRFADGVKGAKVEDSSGTGTKRGRMAVDGCGEVCV